VRAVLIAEAIALLSPHTKTPPERAALLASCCPELLPQIDTAGATDGFLPRALNELYEYGRLPSGEYAVIALLQAVREKMGIDKQARLDKLCDNVRREITSETRPRLLFDGDDATKQLAAVMGDVEKSLIQLASQVYHMDEKLERVEESTGNLNKKMNGNGEPGVSEQLRKIERNQETENEKNARFRREARTTIYILILWCVILTLTSSTTIYMLMTGVVK